MRCHIYISLVLVLMSFQVFPQGTPVEKRVPVKDTIRLENRTVVSGSWTVNGLPDSLFDFHYDPQAGTLFIDTETRAREVSVTYRVFPFNLYQRTSGREYRPDSSVTNEVIKKEPVYRPTHERLVPLGEVQSAGSLTRGIAIGSTRSMAVTSAMNLNLSGAISENLNIRASITDQNVPYQPEGNTLRLNDINNVYFELYNDRFTLAGGDVLFNDHDSYFLKYRKNVKGARVSMNKGKTAAGFSVGKGQWTSVNITPVDGVQGPYRVPAPPNRSFTVILANSEKVFLDGKRMARGFNNDYVIDYNQGEITFMPGVVITRFSRIRVEYEYHLFDQQRSVWFGHHEQKVGKAVVRMNVYQEQDGKSGSAWSPLTEADKIALSLAGDQVDSLYRESADSTGFEEDVILYRKISRWIDGRQVEYFEYSVNPDSAHFRVKFSDVGEGNGDYVRAGQEQNGVIYRWVPPVAGNRQGRYAPVTVLHAPGRKTVMELGVTVPAGRMFEVYTDLAASNYDRNIYSDLDAQDDKGIAVRSGIRLREVALANGYHLRSRLQLEFTQRHFAMVDRFRSVEFDRDWSLNQPVMNLPADDKILTSSVELEKDARNRLSHRFSWRNREAQVNGFQQELNLRKQLGQLEVTSDLFVMRNRLENQDAAWDRAMADVSYGLGAIRPGYRFSLDQHQVKSETDSVISSAMYFREHQFYVRNNHTAGARFEVSYALREDDLPVEGSMARSFSSRTLRSSLSLDIGKDHTLRSVMTYREIHDRLTEEKDRTVAARIDWRGNMLDGILRTDLNYSVANGRELRREYVYLKVPPGEGTHTWRDDNGDGIQDLDEFYEAINPDERNFVKVFTPTQDYVEAFTNLLNFRADIRFPATWKRAGGIRALLYRFSNITSFNGNIRHRNQDPVMQFVPFLKELQLDEMVSKNYNFRSTLFFNRGYSGFGANLGYVAIDRNLPLTNGFEQNSRQTLKFAIRYSLNRFYGVRLEGSSGTRSSMSDVFFSRNYRVDHYTFSPVFTWQPNPALRITSSYQHARRWNSITAEQPAFSITHEARGEMRISKATATSLTATLRVSHIEYQGPLNTPLSYELLQALQPGYNTTLSVSWMQRIMKGLQMTLSYDGRKSEETRLIHAGRMAVTALF